MRDRVRLVKKKEEEEIKRGTSLSLLQSEDSAGRLSTTLLPPGTFNFRYLSGRESDSRKSNKRVVDGNSRGGGGGQEEGRPNLSFTMIVVAPRAQGSQSSFVRRY